MKLGETTFCLRKAITKQNIFIAPEVRINKKMVVDFLQLTTECGIKLLNEKADIISYNWVGFVSSLKCVSKALTRN